MNCPYKHPCCDTKVETVGSGIHCTHDCVNDLLERIERMKRKIKRLEAAKCKKSRKKRP